MPCPANPECAARLEAAIGFANIVQERQRAKPRNGDTIELPPRQPAETVRDDRHAKKSFYGSRDISRVVYQRMPFNNSASIIVPQFRPGKIIVPYHLVSLSMIIWYLVNLYFEFAFLLSGLVSVKAT